MTESISFQVSFPKTAYQALKRIAKKSHKSESDVMLDALRIYLDPLAKVDPFLGMFADEADMMNEATADAMRTRETTTEHKHFA